MTGVPSLPTATELQGLLEFLRRVEALKATLRSGRTSAGRRESTAEHTWRLALAAGLVGSLLPDIDTDRLIRICLIHDLGEALTGDIPAPDQPAGGGDREQREAEAVEALTAPLPPPLRRQILDLWREYAEAATPEARLAKGLDKLETCLQHAQADQEPDFDHRFNLTYSRRWTDGHPVLQALRSYIDTQTARHAPQDP